jgi:F0F1-type ATP synthase assembly protein I
VTGFGGRGARQATQSCLPMPQQKKNPWVQVAEYTSLAFTLPACTAAGYLIGYGLDRLFHTSFLSIVFLILGIAGGFIELIRQVQKDAGDH